MTEVKPKRPMTLEEKIAQLIRFLGSPFEEEAITALCRLRGLLNKNGLDIHIIATRYERGGEAPREAPLSAGEMQKIYDAAYQKGYADGAEHGRRSAVFAAQPIGIFAGTVDDGVNGHGWQQISQHCLANKHLFYGRDLEFVESIADQLTRFSYPKPKQAPWLRDLFMCKFGGRIE
jgi:hypothetical protein